jgi:integrase/recombinase XerD
VAPVTRARYAALLRSVGVTARKRYRLNANPFEDLEVVVPDLDAPATFTMDECRLLASDLSINAPFGLMVALALYAGLRLRECAWLRWSDVHADDAEGFIAIDPPTENEREAGARLKRNKRRSALLMDELAAILAARRPEDDDYIMPEDVRGWDTQQHGRAFAKHLKLLNITKDERSFHSLRHTFASIALAVGIDGMRLQLSMGHAGAEMTRHYAQGAARLRGAVRDWPRGEITFRRVIARKEKTA